MVENAKTQRITALRARRRNQADTTRTEVLRQAGVAPLDLTFIYPGPHAPEADNAQARGRKHFEPARALNAFLCIKSERHGTFDSLGKSRNTEVLQRQPDFEHTRGAS